MGKMLLGGFALSLGLSGFVGLGSTTPSPISAASVVKQHAKQRPRIDYILQQNEAAAAEAEAAQQAQQQAAQAEQQQ